MLLWIQYLLCSQSQVESMTENISFHPMALALLPSPFPDGETEVSRTHSECLVLAGHCEAVGSPGMPTSEEVPSTWWWRYFPSLWPPGLGPEVWSCLGSAVVDHDRQWQVA